MAVLDFVFLYLFGSIYFVAADINDVINKKNFVYWPNATVPFYINPAHFDREQALSIMTSLSLFAFKTCLKFLPVMAMPQDAEHVLVLQNPGGQRQCRWSNEGHSIEEPHRVNLGFQCLQSPQIEMSIMKALGFPFEHNRASRDLFIDVQYENIEPNAVELFTKDSMLPPELRNLPYDVNSVMHFGDRDFSQNGHRTFIIKDRSVKQNRIGLSDTDLRKIEIVYGSECQKRDRQEKIDLCQVYPGAVRKKREVDPEKYENLRVNRDITPPPNKNLTNDVVNMLKDLGIVKEVEDIIDAVYKTAAIAVENAKTAHCNHSKDVLRNSNPITVTRTDPTVQTIVEAIAKFSQSFVNISIANITVLCNSKDAIEFYQRIHCDAYTRDPRCHSYYKSTKSGPVIHYTQHRPVLPQSTKHTRLNLKHKYARTENQTVNNSSDARGKREAHKSSEESLNVEAFNKTSNLEDLKDPNGSKQILRSITSVSPKREQYAPARRLATRFRIYSRKNNFDANNFKSKDRKRISQKKRYWSDNVEDSEEVNRKEKEKVRPFSQKKLGKKIPSIWGTRGIPITVRLSKKNEEFYADRKWPDGVVKYVITDYKEYDLQDLRARIKKVNDILTNNTCVQVKELSENEAKRHRDYLVLDTSPDYVTGRVGGRQVFGSVELFKGVSHKQHTAMMVMAWLGFYFEVSRHDRDNYVVVHNRHIRPDKLHHFEKIRSDATIDLTYDYNSATHPSWQFWRKLGKKGISVVATHKDKDPDGSIMKSFGQNSQLLSDLDIIKINSVYGVKCFLNKGTRNTQT